jgi:nucleoid-associated protein YgaU
MLKVQPEQPSLGLPSLVRPKAPRRPPDANSSQGRVSPFLPRPRLAQPPAIQVMPVVPTDAEMMVPRPVAPVAPRVANPDVRSSIATQMIRVEQGDSWWRLAVRYLGSGKRWMELRAMNPADSGQQDLLKVGTTVFVARRERRQVNSSDLPGEEGPLRIKPGDTLWTLAREHLGRGSAWTCLASLNPQIVDYTHIPIGTSIQLPAGQSSCSAAGESLR